MEGRQPSGRSAAQPEGSSRTVSRDRGDHARAAARREASRAVTDRADLKRLTDAGHQVAVDDQVMDLATAVELVQILDTIDRTVDELEMDNDYRRTGQRPREPLKVSFIGWSRAAPLCTSPSRLRGIVPGRRDDQFCTRLASPGIGVEVPTRPTVPPIANDKRPAAPAGDRCRPHRREAKALQGSPARQPYGPTRRCPRCRAPNLGCVGPVTTGAQPRM